MVPCLMTSKRVTRVCQVMASVIITNIAASFDGYAAENGDDNEMLKAANPPYLWLRLIIQQAN